MKKKSILIVDDEKNTREGLARALQFSYHVRTAADGEQALAALDAEPADVVLSDLRMPGMDGLTLLRRVLARTPQPVFILLTAYGRIETAVDAMRAGAADFLTKPVNLDQLEIILRRSLEARELAGENRRLREQLDARYGTDAIVGQSPTLRDVLDALKQAAPSRATVLIEGESGTGKELVAHALHRLSPRAQGPFVAVHCAALAPTLLESELFGHEKGAFTGAAERRLGRFELADGGTLFLDEIGEIDPAVQVKILRVLEERRFERVGGQQTIEVDVRLVAATNRDLPALVAVGKFREDLFFRLNVIVLSLPPLRDRVEDIPLLADRFLKDFAAENGRTVPALAPDALEALTAYAWPGNVRELRNAIERMVVMGRGDRLTFRDLPPAVRAAAGGAGRGRRVGGALPPSGRTLADMEKHMIRQALERHDGNKVAASKDLGISRRTLHRKLTEFGWRAPRGEPTVPSA